MLDRDLIHSHLSTARDSVRKADPPIGVITAVDRLILVIGMLLEEIESLSEASV
jgi:hypothetical protein